MIRLCVRYISVRIPQQGWGVGKPLNGVYCGSGEAKKRRAGTGEAKPRNQQAMSGDANKRRGAGVSIQTGNLILVS